MTTVLDPTSESHPEQRELVSRPESLDGLTIALLGRLRHSGTDPSYAR